MKLFARGDPVKCNRGECFSAPFIMKRYKQIGCRSPVYCDMQLVQICCGRVMLSMQPSMAGTIIMTITCSDSI